MPDGVEFVLGVAVGLLLALLAEAHDRWEKWGNPRK